MIPEIFRASRAFGDRLKAAGALKAKELFWKYPGPVRAVKASESECLEYVPIAPARQLDRRQAAYADDKLRAYFEMRRFSPQPATFRIRLKDARVFSDKGIVINRKNEALLGVATLWGAGQEPEKFLAACPKKLPEPVRLEGSLAVLTHVTAARNYGHWMMDGFPRAMLLGEEQADHYLVPCKSKYQKEVLTRAGIDLKKCIQPEEDSHFEAGELIVPSLTGHVANITPEVGSYLQGLFSECREKWGLKKRFYISRGDTHYRRVLNEDAIFSALQPLGFEKLEMSGLSVSDQAKTFGSAEMVVGAHGAGFTNLVFSQPGTKLVEIYAPSFVNPVFWALCSEMNHIYGCLQADRLFPLIKGNPINLYSDIRISPDQIVRAVDELLER